MRPASALLFVLPAALAASASAQEPLKPITSLDEALQIALSKAPAVRQVNERLIKTQRTLDQILGAAKRPTVTSSATYTRLSGLGAAFGGGGGGISPAQLQNPFPVGLQTTPPGTIPVQLSNSGAAAATRSRQVGGGTGGNTSTPDLNQYSVRVGVSQLVDLTGVVRTAEHLGSTEEKIVLEEIQRVRQETALSVKSGYYNVLRAEALVRVSAAAVSQSEAQLKVAESQLKAGTVAAFDVLRAKTQLANNQQSLISARNQIAIARNAFANSLGIDPSTPVTLPAPPPVEEAAAIPPLPDLDEAKLVAQALKQRPEAIQAQLNEAKASQNTRLARRTLDPYASVSLSSTYNPKPALVANEKTTGSLSVTLVAPLYDGGATRAAVAAAHVDERTAAIQTDQFQRGIKAEVQQAVVAVKDAEERARTAWASVEQAREAYRLAGVRYAANVDTQLAVNDAQTALVQAETNVVNARYDYLAALARLSRALGEKI